MKGSSKLLHRVTKHPRSTSSSLPRNCRRCTPSDRGPFILGEHLRPPGESLQSVALTYIVIKCLTHPSRKSVKGQEDTLSRKTTSLDQHTASQDNMPLVFQSRSTKRAAARSVCRPSFLQLVAPNPSLVPQDAIQRCLSRSASWLLQRSSPAARDATPSRSMWMIAVPLTQVVFQSLRM
jgi:hypothetical protein